MNYRFALVALIGFSSLSFQAQVSELMIQTPPTDHGITPSIANVIQTYNGTINHHFTAGREGDDIIWVVGFDDQYLQPAFDQISALPEVVQVEYNHQVQTQTRYVPNDVLFFQQWYLDNNGVNGEVDADVDLPEAWALEKGSEDVLLVIMDSGVEFGHPEFNGREYTNPIETNNFSDSDGNGYIDDTNGWDFVDNDNDPNDERGHGTAVAGIAAANGDDARGYAGVDWNCKIMSLRVLNGNGSGSYSWLAEALYYAANIGADVVNMSLGGLGESSILSDAAAYAASQNCLLIAASGNHGTNEPMYPASLPTVMSVGAIDWNNDRCDPYSISGTGGSGFGPFIELVAPGDRIPILNHENYNDYTDVQSGTSFAAPIVSGIACLIKARFPKADATMIRNLLHATAEDELGRSFEDVPGRDDHHGYGRVNAFEALSADIFTVQSSSEHFYVSAEPGERTIRLRLNRDAESLIVVDSRGRTLLQEENLSPQTIRFGIPASGVYTVRAIIDGSVEYRKVLFY